jgi:hypothetical protein
MWTIVVNVVRQAQLRRETSYVQLSSHVGGNPVALYHERNKSVVVRKKEVDVDADEEVETAAGEDSGGGGGGGGGSAGSRSRRRPPKGHAARSFLSLVAIPHDEDLTEAGR